MSWQEIAEKISALPKPSPKIEDCSITLVGSVENIDPGRCFLSRIEEGGGDELSAKIIRIPSIQGGVWIDYYRKYRDVIERRMRILLINKTRHRIFVADSSSPLSPLVLSSKYTSRENSLAFITIPPREATVFEKSSSYATYEIARRKGIPSILIDRSLAGRFYGFTGDRILRHRSLESRIMEIIVSSVEKLSGFLKASERIGSRIYVVSGIIGAGLEVYGDPQNTFRALEKCALWALRDPETLYRSRSVFLIARAPKKLFEKISEAFVKYIGSFPEILVHDSLYVEYSSRLELYDIVLLYGYPGIELPDHIVEGYRSLESLNPEISVEEVIE